MRLDQFISYPTSETDVATNENWPNSSFPHPSPRLLARLIEVTLRPSIKGLSLGGQSSARPTKVQSLVARRTNENDIPPLSTGHTCLSGGSLGQPVSQSVARSVCLYVESFCCALQPFRSPCYGLVYVPLKNQSDYEKDDSLPRFVTLKSRCDVCYSGLLPIPWLFTPSPSHLYHCMDLPTTRSRC